MAAVRLTHPDSSLHLKVEADRVPMYESQGWKAASTTKTPADADDRK